jgi:hypothetical protein
VLVACVRGSVEGSVGGEMEDLHGNVGDLVEEMGRQDVENRNAIAASGRGVGAQCAGFACGNQGVASTWR